MAHAFDGHSFQQLLTDAASLVARTTDLEQRLTRLVTVIEDNGPPLPGPVVDVAVSTTSRPASVRSAPTGLGIPRDLLAAVRDLCVAARDQRQLSESILARLVGDLSQADGSWQRRVLVVDDSNDNRDFAAAVLEASGFHALTASNGLEGIIVAHYAQPAVVLMDVTMPVLDGIEAARLLKASPVTRHLNVIAHTAKPDFFGGPLTRLFVDVLPKPASPDAIVASVQRFVEPARTAAPEESLPES